MVGGTWPSRLPLWLVIGAEGPSVRRMCSDDVTGGQSKPSPGGWRKKSRCIQVVFVNVRRSLHRGVKSVTQLVCAVV